MPSSTDIAFNFFHHKKNMMQRYRSLPSPHPAIIDPLDRNRHGSRTRVERRAQALEGLLEGRLEGLLEGHQRTSTPPCKRWYGEAEAVPRVRSDGVRLPHPRHCLDRAREHTAARPTTRLADAGLSRRAERNRLCHDRNQTEVQANARLEAYARADADPSARLAGRQDNEINYF